MNEQEEVLEYYDGAYAGAQIDSAVAKALAPDTVPTAGSDALITSGGVSTAMAVKENEYVINGVSFKFRKFGRIVTVQASGTNTAQTSTSSYMGTASIASDYYPPTGGLITYSAVVSLSSGLVFAQFNISSSGTLSVGFTTVAVPQNSNWRGIFAYYSAT